MTTEDKKEGAAPALAAAEGDPLPEAEVLLADPGAAPRAIRAAEFCGPGAAVLFAVPGAFTPTCTARHLPGFVEAAEALRAAGAGPIGCLSANDPFVMAAWGEQAGAPAAGVSMLADPSAALARAMGAARDLGPALGVRWTRLAMVVRGGRIAVLRPEPGRGLAASSAESMLEALAPPAGGPSIRP